ncbi:DM13 domain-containing protein [Virgisporangium aliadipatigenens]|uniref:DM13 domain-containing protein n=1 Tax=Virgisporangium aliadipatigenens TaxID=741659 RepID=UPI0035709B22
MRFTWLVLRKPLFWVGIASVAAVVVAFGLYWFQPWKLVTNETADDPLAAVPPAATAPATPGAPSGSATAAAPPAGPRVLLKGEFITHEHDTSGSARVVVQPDGSRTLEIADLDTSNGPDLRVWLSDQPVKQGTAGWTVFDDGKWVELGKLKGNKGNQVYDIPASADLDSLRSVTIWCKRFSVSFGAAALA